MSLAAIIMPYHNLANRTLECLASLQKRTHYADTWLILVDNGSEPEQGSLVDEYLLKGYGMTWTHLRLAENGGWVGGCIAGYECATSDAEMQPEWIVLLNNDTILSSGWLTRMITALRDNVRYGVMGCVSVGGRGWQRLDQLQERGWIEASIPTPRSPKELERLGFLLRSYHGFQVHNVGSMVAFFCAVLRREMLDQIGFLDERIGMGAGDDDDLCRRARERGWKIGLALDVPIWHYHHQTFNQLYAGRQEPPSGVTPMKELVYLGGRSRPYIMGVPARDLDSTDLMQLASTGFDRETLLHSGLYAETSELEVHPFCGVQTESGEPCQRPVDAWGDHCWQHLEETE